MVKDYQYLTQKSVEEYKHLLIVVKELQETQASKFYAEWIYQLSSTHSALSRYL